MRRLVRAQVEGYGLQVSALAAGNDFVVLEEEAIRSQVTRMERICRNCETPRHLGSPHGGWLPQKMLSQKVDGLKLWLDV